MLYIHWLNISLVNKTWKYYFICEIGNTVLQKNRIFRISYYKPAFNFDELTHEVPGKIIWIRFFTQDWFRYLKANNLTSIGLNIY